MKWKLYSIANIINLIAALAFGGFAAYMYLLEKASEWEPAAIVVFSCSVIFVKAFLSIHYQQKLRLGEGYFIIYKWLYVVLGILQFVMAGFLTYGVYQMLKDFSAAVIEWTYVFGLTDFIAFIITSLIVLIIDFSLVKHLKRLSDLSIGILEESDK
jgi:hypothetical protein